MHSRWRIGGIIVLVAMMGITIAAVGEEEEERTVTAALVAAAEKIIGIEFTQTERDSLLDDLEYYLKNYAALRAVPIANSVPPAFGFNPMPIGFSISGEDRPIVVGPVKIEMPNDIEDLAFYSVLELSALISARKVSSTDLTKMYIERLKEHGPELECVVTLTEELALEQARRADEEIAAGNYRGYLHGIPYGAKDLLAVPAYRTTWGAEPYKDQVLDETATVIRKLEDAGAVLVAKLTLGALAWGDVWYGGTTRNPWDIEQGSSGSSAGPASATSAGLVAFSIGTETWGSIVSPSTRCGTTGLRPTYGRVSRAGAMALSWTMDKIGPICRTVVDCAIVFDVIRGSDGLDQTVVDAPFNYDHRVDLSELRIAYVKGLFAEGWNADADSVTLVKLRELGAELIPIELPDYPVEALGFILTAEAAAAFDELTRSNRDDLLVRQVKNAWPNAFRAARLIPAVEYIQANRLRWIIMQEMEKLEFDVYISPSFGGNNLLLTNLTGHPSVVLPNGFNDEGSPVSITFMGRLFGEATLLAVANAYQDATDFHHRHPQRYLP